MPSADRKAKSKRPPSFNRSKKGRETEKLSLKAKASPIIEIGRLSVFVSVLLLVACFLSCTRTDNKSAGPAEKVTIAYSATTDAVLAEVANTRGYYREEGLEEVPHMHPYGKPALREVMEGKADFATVAETPVMFAVMKGEKISIIATIQTSTKSSAIIARKDKGILNPGDLKGRKIAATLGTTS